jgi:hypothetical protein
MRKLIHDMRAVTLRWWLLDRNGVGHPVEAVKWHLYRVFRDWRV